MSLGLNLRGNGSLGQLLTGGGRMCRRLTLSGSVVGENEPKGGASLGRRADQIDQLLAHLRLSFQCRDPQCWS